MEENKVQNIDGYINGFPVNVQNMMRQIRETIHKASPGITETISWGMPTFSRNGILIQFAGYAKHIGLYPGPEAVEAFMPELAGYNTSKGTIQLPLDKPLPVDLIVRILNFRLAENNANAAKKNKK